MLNNYKLVISYLGTNYKGYQFQTDFDTIEKNIKIAIKEIFRNDIKMIAAGRTDTGVHAENQIINFKTEKYIDEKILKNALNRYLKQDIYVKEIGLVDVFFNARKSAKFREYQYLFTNDEIPLYLRNIVEMVKFSPELKSVYGIKKILIGQHDFINFRKIGSNEKSTIRKINDFNITRKKINDLYFDNEFYYVYVIKIVADSFLYSMVRNLVGAIFEIFKGNANLKDLEEMIHNKSRYNYTKASSKGLSLVKIGY